MEASSPVMEASFRFWCVEFLFQIAIFGLHFVNNLLKSFLVQTHASGRISLDVVLGKPAFVAITSLECSSHCWKLYVILSRFTLWSAVEWQLRCNHIIIKLNKQILEGKGEIDICVSACLCVCSPKVRSWADSQSSAVTLFVRAQSALLLILGKAVISHRTHLILRDQGRA